MAENDIVVDDMTEAQLRKALDKLTRAFGQLYLLILGMGDEELRDAMKAYMAALGINVEVTVDEVEEAFDED